MKQLAAAEAVMLCHQPNQDDDEMRQLAAAEAVMLCHQSNQGDDETAGGGRGSDAMPVAKTRCR